MNPTRSEKFALLFLCSLFLLGNGVAYYRKHCPTFTLNVVSPSEITRHEAAFEASRVRTRPILMSALTSAMGLVPIALGLGEGSELRAPLAVTTIGGLLSSTFLSLLVLPCFYVLSARWMARTLGEEVE